MSASPPPATDQAGRSSRVPVLAAASFATSTQTFVVSGLLNEMASDLAIPVAQAGQVATVFAMAFGLSAPFLAALTARWPRRRLLVGMLCLLALLNGLIVVTHSFAALMGLRLLCGMAAGMVVPAAAATAAALSTPEHRGRALATVVAGSTCAFLFGVPLGSLAGEVFGWRGAFGLAALLSLGAALAIRLLLPEVAGEHGGMRGLGNLMRTGVRKTLAVTFLAFGASFCTSAFIGPAVNRVSGLTGGQVGLMQALVGAASFAGIPLGAWMADHGAVRKLWLLPAVMVLAALAHYALLSGAADGMASAILFQGGVILVAGACAFALAPLLQTRLVALVPEARNVVLAANSSAMFLGQATGALLAGIAIAGLGIQGIAAAGAAMAFAACLVAAWMNLGAPPSGRRG
ncbi:MFS transporter [Roseomonas gilardii]|uniref:MFS transporter n=1 Tax=Roseomonas gilardii TaxID=257708 RepID=A0ABU3ME09_9PROT|nr:MFS transporter [Roseomonas gilardii]MDT8331178.1 MFS transporter [Roseomonas gilardii]